MDESDTVLAIDGQDAGIEEDQGEQHDQDAESHQKEEKIEPRFILQTIRKLSSACDQKNISQVKKICSNCKILKNNNAVKNFDKTTLSSPKSIDRYKRTVINSLLQCHKLEKVEDNNELYFVVAALSDIDNLKPVMETFTKEDINQVKNTDSVIIFVLKFGNIYNENFFKCMETLINRGVDINKYDGTGKTAIDHVALLHEWYKGDSEIEARLITLGHLLLKQGIYENDNKITLDFLEKVMEVDLKQYHFKSVSKEAKLFYWITKTKIKEILNFKEIKKVDVNCDNGEYTLLQFTSAKSNKMSSVVQFLLKNKADPNKVTKWNQQTPLELAGYRNYQQVFEVLLKCEETKVTLQQYSNFVRWRLHPMKAKLFELLLESDKINPDFIYEKTGNTPLHYAILFSQKKAVQNLLKRGSSLVVKNNFGKRALEIIDPADLETYFDSCLALDNYTPYFSDVHYKMKFRFGCLIDRTDQKEIKVVAKIGKSPNLKHLLSHPFIHTFLSLKWCKTKYYFYPFLLIQAALFITLSFLFFDLPDSSHVQYHVAAGVGLVNILTKVLIFLNFKMDNAKPVFFVLKRVRLHATMEILLVLTIIGSLVQRQFRAYLFIEMAVSFLLTAGYHPHLSKWSVMLQKVFKTFTILLIFFSLLVFGFSAGFRITFNYDQRFFGNFSTALFKTFMMTTGEFETSENEFTAEFGGYLLFLLFAMSMSLVIVNFWTGVAVTDIGRIEQESETNSFKNVIIFMMFVDYVYSVKYFKKLRRLYVKPLLFFEIDSKNEIYHTPGSNDIDFFVNRSRQFEDKDFPARIDPDCFNKIRLHYYKLQEVPAEEKIMSKLEELSKALHELRASIKQSDSGKIEIKAKKLKISD